MSLLETNLAALPETAYVVLSTTGETVIVKRGETGYYNPNYGPQGAEIVASLNKRMGVTPAQASAMEFGSMFGWDTPGASVDSYDENGRFKRPAKGH
ncbi:hypothetical protein D869_gp218 [Caulobacter phage CcrRogue]|uniref:Uncharacterized protein n=1 Tax=Caulobacter phage CcrRogue TaxID=2927986 RepID=K4JNW2_9CAUD|nr:hypothetical protein D869_gp218 [Caulobacter phage CcrRogue]AFU86696.1 hypothetical protein CcrRogue_gp214 [Caulobacter phage CcrRogue]